MNFIALEELNLKEGDEALLTNRERSKFCVAKWEKGEWIPTGFLTESYDTVDLYLDFEPYAVAFLLEQKAPG